MKCPFCGAEVRRRYCEYCDSENPNWKPEPSFNYENPEPFYRSAPQYDPPAVSDRQKLIALLLCIFTGVYGGHYFYVRKYGMGVLYLCTLGFFTFGVIFDIFRILTGSFTDANGLPLDGSDMSSDMSSGTEKSRKSLYKILTIVCGICALSTFTTRSGGLVSLSLIAAIVFGILWYKENRNGQ